MAEAHIYGNGRRREKIQTDVEADDTAGCMTLLRARAKALRIPKGKAEMRIWKPKRGVPYIYKT